MSKFRKETRSRFFMSQREIYGAICDDEFGLVVGLARLAKAAGLQGDAIDLEAGFGRAGFNIHHIGNGDFLALATAFAQ